MKNNENINIDLIVLNIYRKKQDYEKIYNNKLFLFLNKAYELVDISEDIYQVEQTIKLNKISLKDYVLSSEICNLLKINNIINYSIDDLKQIINNYEIGNSLELTSYKMALYLYEILEELESIELEKINYEISGLTNIFENINDIKSIKKDKYAELYNKIIKCIQEEYISDKKINEQTNNYIIQILNDIFNYYLYGNKKIPLEESFNYL